MESSYDLLKNLGLVLALPLAWVHARQNRADEAAKELTAAVGALTVALKGLEVHNQYVKESIDEIKEHSRQRRGDD